MFRAEKNENENENESENKSENESAIGSEYEGKADDGGSAGQRHRLGDSQPL